MAPWKHCLDHAAQDPSCSLRGSDTGHLGLLIFVSRGDDMSQPLTLPEQGYRFLITIDRQQWGWTHPAEASTKLESGWIDVTDLTDAELDAFVMAK